MLLAKHADVLTRYTRTSVQRGAITVLVSGNRPVAEMRAEATRLAALDGRVNDLNGKDPPSLIPMISERWGALFKWRGDGAFPAAEATLLRELVEKAHKQGRRIRFLGHSRRPGRLGDAQPGRRGPAQHRSSQGAARVPCGSPAESEVSSPRRHGGRGARERNRG